MSAMKQLAGIALFAVLVACVPLVTTSGVTLNFVMMALYATLIAQAQRGTLAGLTAPVEIAFGIARPVRTMTLATPLLVGPLADRQLHPAVRPPDVLQQVAQRPVRAAGHGAALVGAAGRLAQQRGLGHDRAAVPLVFQPAHLGVLLVAVLAPHGLMFRAGRAADLRGRAMGVACRARDPRASQCRWPGGRRRGRMAVMSHPVDIEKRSARTGRRPAPAAWAVRSSVAGADTPSR